jgi:hypothetical protein
MQPIAKEEFNKLTLKEKREHAQYWASLSYKLKEYELKYLSGDDREKYLDDKSNSGTWLDDYEFKALDVEHKKTYISKKKFLADNEVKRLDSEMQKFYVDNLTSNKLSMSDEAFSALSDDKIKNLYVTGRMKNANPINLKGAEISVLNHKQQIEYVDYFLGLNSNVIRPEYLEILKPSIKKYYLDKSSYVNEIRKMVKSIVRKII